MEAEGTALAQARRQPFRQLIKSDPQEALANAVPMVVRQQLPLSVLEQLEERLNGVAVLRVMQGMPAADQPLPAESLTFREAEFRGGKTYRAYVYGRFAQKVTSTPGASLNGVAIDADFAVNDSPSRKLEVGEIPNAAKPVVSICPISGKATASAGGRLLITADTPAVETAIETVRFCDPAHIEPFNQTIILGEGVSGGVFGFTGILPSTPTPALGNVRVLAIPMTYADQNAVPSTEAAMYATLRDVAEFYAKASFGRISLVGAVSPPVKLPHNEAWYVNRDTSNGGDISGTSVEHLHAREEARKLGFDANDYDCVVVRHNGGPGSYGGLAGGSSVWARDNTLRVWAHEIGHTFGLAHANFWDTAGTSAIGAGTNQEYGHDYDMMSGANTTLAHHFNSQAKNQIRWMPSNFVENVSQSGVYRIYALDQGVLLPDRRYAMAILKDVQRTYWGEVRSLFDSNPWIRNGMFLGWRYPNGGATNLQLIDTTPGSPFLKEDSPISLGRTFSDTESGIHMTTVAVNDSPRYADVVVNFGSFAGNHAPTLAFEPSPTIVPLGTTVTLTATASDEDGDTLAYSWQHFGDTSVKLVSGNAPVISRTFSTAGSYIVACTVSDMKGGSSTRNRLITVGNGNSRFTISGRVTLLGQGLQDVVVTANGANGVVTDAEGYYTIPNLAVNTYSMTPLLYGYTFSELFNNSVSVGPNGTGADFEATPTPVVTITASIPTANELAPVTAGKFTLTRTGDTSQQLIVNVNSLQGGALKGNPPPSPTNDYSIAPDYVAGSQGFSTFTIPADSATLDVVVTPNTDATTEGPETVVLQLGPGSGYLVGSAATATIVIADDDTALPKVSLAVATAATNENSGTPAAFRFTRTGLTNSALTVSYTRSGTATSGADFTALSGSATIPIGATSVVVNVPPLDDSASEPLETVTLTTSSNPTVYLIDPLATTASVSLIDDDVQVVTVSATDPSAKEVDLSQPGALADTGTFVVTRSGDTSNPLTVYYALTGTPGSGVTAQHGADYETLPGLLTLPAGTSQAAVTIIPRFDSFGEGPETATLSLGAGTTNYVLGTPASATITITDAAADTPYVDVVNISSAAEPSTSGTFRFTARGIPNTSTLTVRYTLSGTALNGTDFDGGNAWLGQASGTSVVLRAVWGTSTTSVWAVGDSGTIRKWNGSAWSAQTSNTPSNLRSIWGTSSTNVWAVGDSGTILRWNGTVWSAQTFGTNHLRAVWGSDTNNVWAVGDAGTILKWNGTAWSAQTSGIATALFSVWGNSSTSLWAVGAGGVILRSENGTNWTAQISGVSTALSGVWGTSGTSIWAVGAAGVILRSTTGTTWTTQTSNTSVDLTAIRGTDANNLWVSGGAGTVLRTSSGGTSWTTLTTNVVSPLLGVWPASTSNIWAVGDGGAIANLNTAVNVALSGSVIIPAGATVVDLTIRPIDDVLAEDLENLVLTITPDAAYQTFAPTASATMWVRDNEQPTVYVDTQVGTSGSSTVTEGPAIDPTKFYISRTGSTTNALTVNYTIGGNATPGSDYTALSGTVSIPAGSLGVDVPLTISNDSLVEGTETITFDFAAGSYARSPGTVMWIADDESNAQTVAFATASAAGSESAIAVNVPVTLASPASGPVTVEYAVDSGTRASSTSTINTQTLPYWVRMVKTGTSFASFVSNNGTTWVQLGATQTLSGFTATNYLAGLCVCAGADGSLSTVVFDNVTVSGLSAGGSQGVITSADIGAVAATGSYSESAGTCTVAGSGADIWNTVDEFRYAWFPVTSSANCTVTARVTSQTNTAAWAKAGVMIRESNAAGARHAMTVATPGNGRAYQYRGTTNGTSTAVTNVSTLLRPLWLRLQRSGDVFTSAESPDGSTWSTVGPPKTMALAPGVLAGLAVSARNDSLVATATFDNVSLTGSPTLVGRTVGFVNTQGTDNVAGGLWTVSAAGAQIGGTEDECHFVAAPVSGDFTLVARVLTQSGGNSNAQAGVMVRETANFRGRSLYLGSVANAGAEFIVRDSSVTNAFGAGIDYMLAPGVLNFAIGEQSKNIPLMVIDDSTVEGPDNLTIVLRNPNGAQLGTTTQFTYTIIDNDSAAALPFAGFASTASSVSEAAGTTTFPVTLSAAAAGPVSIDYAVTGGTAVSPADYTLANGTVTFAPGETVKGITMTLAQDPGVESNETVTVTLSNPSGVQFGTLSTHTLTILDDDFPTVNIVATDDGAAESGNTGLFTVTRAGSLAGPLTVSFVAGSGTATSGEDYTGIATPGTLVIPDGQASATVTVTPIQDESDEGSETVVIALAADPAYTIGTPANATVTIADDDRSSVTIAASKSTASETSGNNGRFTITCTPALSSSLAVNLTISGTAANGTDYTTIVTPVTIAASETIGATETTAEFDIVPIDDLATEGPEDVIVAIAAATPSGPFYDIGAANFANVTIADNDNAPVLFISNPSSQGPLIANGNGVILTATATDDGLPQPVAFSWSAVAGPGTATIESPTSATTAVTFSATGTYVLRVTATDGQFTVTDQVTVVVGAALMAADWITQDLGPSSSRRGQGLKYGELFSISGAGTGYASTGSDQAHVMVRPVDGDATVVARLTSFSSTGALAGLTMRDAMPRGARRAVLGYVPGTGLQFRTRTTASANDSVVTQASVPFPLWLRLERNSTTSAITASYAADAANAPGTWTPIGAPTVVNMDSRADLGLTTTSNSSSSTATALFDNVAITPAPSGPACLSEDSAALPAAAGSGSVSNGTYTINGSTNGYFYGWQYYGDLMVTARLANTTSGAGSAKSGIRIAESMESGAYAHFGRIPSGAYNGYVWTSVAGGGGGGVPSGVSNGNWIRMVRRGNSITGYRATDVSGSPGAWTQIGQPQTVIMTTAVFVGFSVDNATGVGLNTATFTNLSVVPLNKAPIVDAGSVGTTPITPVSINASVTDDDYPAPPNVNILWTAIAGPGGVSFGNPNALATTASFAVDGNYVLRLRASDGSVESFGDLSFTAYTSRFAVWQGAQFPGGSSNPLAAWNFDADQDGLTNAFEYGYGSSATVANSDPVVYEMSPSGPDRYFRVTLPKNPNATDLTYQVEATSDLTNPTSWTSAGLVIEVDNATSLRVRDNAPMAPGQRRFMRVKITTPQ